MAHDREVAGVRCMEVLGMLSEYLDDELELHRRQALEAHLAGCDWCARFGGEVGEVVEKLRRELGAPPPPPAGVDRRLAERLRDEIGE